MSPLWLWFALLQMGSPGGGETQAIAFDPGNPDIIYAGAAKGLCKTTRGGKDNWPAVGLEGLSPRVIVVDPGAASTIWAGTYEMGVQKSIDGGMTWAASNHGLSDGRVRALELAGGILYAGFDGAGVFRSSDAGATWTEANRGLIDKVVRALVADPNDPKVLYAGTWHGVYKTVDGGEQWTADPEGLYDVDVAALALDPSNPSVIYAATNPRGVWRSGDGGKTWKAGERPLTEVLQSIAVDPGNPEHVYVGTRAGVWRSVNAGRTFERAGLAWSNSAWTLVFDGRTRPATLYYGGVGGVLKTTTGGKRWDVTGPVRP
ncbi:MAG: hypothetical protein R2762_27260 [Bryobacteraceae bacterium]